MRLAPRGCVPSDIECEGCTFNVALGQKQIFRSATLESPLLPIGGDRLHEVSDVRFGPIADIGAGHLFAHRPA